MPRQRTNQLINCPHFTWKLSQRNGVWQADGRSNRINAGRYSLNTKDEAEARRRVAQLDLRRAEDLGITPRTTSATSAKQSPLTLEKGRELYETHIGRPRVLGGVAPSTRKRYRAVFDKFIAFARNQRQTSWNQVDAALLTKYAQHLEQLPTRKGNHYEPKTILNEMVTLKQTVKWLITSGHLPDKEPIDLTVKKVESESPYCYQANEINAMVEFCRARPHLVWLGHVILALATTGLRISELCALKWSDIDLAKEFLRLTDESAFASVEKGARRRLKSGRSRSLPLKSELLEVFRQLKRVDHYVFHGPRGGRLKPDTVRRIFVTDVLAPLAERFPSNGGEKGFRDGRLHSFRHYFCSTCANGGAPERMVMEWLGHADSAMVRLYYHLHDEEARRRMNELDFIGRAARCSDSAGGVATVEDVAADKS